jgi:hypothetical protein
VDRVKLKAKLLDDLLELLADRQPNPNSEFDLNRRKRIARIVPLMARLKNKFIRSIRMFSPDDLPYTVEAISDQFFAIWNDRKDVTDVLGGALHSSWANPILLYPRKSYS